MKKNVYELAMRRIETVFSEFDNVYISFSGGKDSGVMLNLCIRYLRASGLKRKIGVFHMDYEVQYDETTRYIDRVFRSNPDIIECVCPSKSVPVPLCISRIGDPGTKPVKSFGSGKFRREVIRKRTSRFMIVRCGIMISRCFLRSGIIG